MNLILDKFTRFAKLMELITNLIPVGQEKKKKLLGFGFF
jgi:hypothetical protein